MIIRLAYITTYNMKAKLLFFFIGLFFLVCAHHIMSANDAQEKQSEAKVKVVSIENNTQENLQ